MEVTSATAGTAKGGPTITPVFKIVGGPLAGKRAMGGKLSFAETALWKTIPILRGFGLDDQFLMQADSQPDSIKVIADSLVGRVVDIRVTLDEWQGEERNKLASVRRATDHVAPPSMPGQGATAVGVGAPLGAPTAQDPLVQSTSPRPSF